MLLVVAGVVAAAASTVLAIALNVATGGTARWFPLVERYPLWWTGGATVAVAGAGLLVWWAQRWYDRGSEELLPTVLPLEPWVVGRPDEVNQVVAVLRRKATTGITGVVHGAGGFGKTTITEMVRADPRLLRHFQGRVHRVTVGRDVRGRELVRLVNGLIEEVQRDPVTFTSVQQAADHLAAVLNAGPRRLLIIDDVWAEEQLAAFPVAGRCARLVTTRNETLAAAAGVPVKIGPMSAKQARTVLLAGLEPLPPLVVQGLIRETGQWPLMMGLVNKILHQRARLHEDISHAAEDLLSTIRWARLQVDELAREPDQPDVIDVSDPQQRRRAIRATIEASTGLLFPPDQVRLVELGMFARNETIPVPVVAALWHTTGGLDQAASESLCARLADLALVTLIRTSDGGALELHDVIRDYLRDEFGADRLEQLHQILLDTVAVSLPAAAAVPGPGTVTAWWELPEQARYLREHLIEHMLAAGHEDEAGQTATDMRWVDARLQASGPSGPYTDLAAVGTPRAERLQRLLGQAAHLLAPTDPPYSLTDILYSRVFDDPDWGSQTRALAAGRPVPALACAWPLPDLPGSALRRTLAGHTGPVHAVAIAPDGTWLATGSWDRSVRIWDAATGRQRATLTGHTKEVRSVAIAPDGGWLASGGADRTVRIWDVVSGRERAALKGHTGAVNAVAVAPDGGWLTSGGADRTVRIWDSATGRQRAILTVDERWPVDAVAIAPDGTWLATSSVKLVQIWDADTGQQLAALTGHNGSVDAVAIAPDGTWLASSGNDGIVRIWDAATWQQRAAVVADEWVGAVAIAPDGTWLASASVTGSVRIWDAMTFQQRVTFTGHTGVLKAVAIAPDGTWLATGSWDKSVRIWDAISGPQGSTQARAAHVSSVAFAPDGTWLACGHASGLVRVWDLATGQERTAAEDIGGATAVAIAPDGTWLATGRSGGPVRILDIATGEEHVFARRPHGQEHVFIRRPHGTAVAIAPDGTWLATAGDERRLAWIWDLRTGEECAALSGHTGRVTSVAIAPDGTWLATGSWDRSVRIWDAATGQLRATLTGHTGEVTSVAIATDGTWLATGSHDGSLRIWDTTTGRVGAVMRVDSSLKDCAWSPAGNLIAAAGDAGLYLFNFNS
jgi:WD40 repeat protein